MEERDLDREARAKVQRLEEIRAELRRRRVANALSYYTPHPKQSVFHSAKNRIRLFQGGNRSGKSHAGVAELVAHFLGYRPWLTKEDPDYWVTLPDGKGGRRRISKASKGLLVGESFGTLTRVQIPKLFGDPEAGEPGLMPMSALDERLPFKRNQQGVIDRINGKNGQQIFLMSYDQDPKLFEGFDIHYAMMDEPPLRRIWKGIWRGLTDHMGAAWLTSTPLSEPWVHEELASDPENFVIYVNTHENVGYGMTELKVAELERGLDADEKITRIQGKPAHLTGLVYKSYSREVHCLKREDFPYDVTYGYWMHVDPHPREPHAAVWVAALPNGVCVVIGAIRNEHPNNLVSDFARQCFNYERQFLGLRSDDVERLIDPLSKTPGVTESGHSIMDEFANHGMEFRAGSKERVTAMAMMRERLNHNKAKGISPTLFFLDDLDGVHREMVNYVYDEHRTARASQDNKAKPEPRKKNDHYIEGIHRILLDEPEAPGPIWAEEHDDYRAAGASGSIGY